MDEQHVIKSITTLTEAAEAVVKDLLARLSAATAALEAAQKDAERYRWLTQRDRWYISVMSDLQDRLPKICCIGHELDATIDAAMSGEGKP